MIHRDGIDWPLQTYLDCYGFVLVERIDEWALTRLQDDHTLLEALIGGELVEKPGCDLPWHDVFAVRNPYARRGMGVCVLCGMICVLGDFDMCEECEDGDCTSCARWWAQNPPPTEITTICGCSPETVAAVLNGGTCSLGGCPYGGDF